MMSQHTSCEVDILRGKSTYLVESQRCSVKVNMFVRRIRWRWRRWWRCEKSACPVKMNRPRGKSTYIVKSQRCSTSWFAGSARGGGGGRDVMSQHTSCEVDILRGKSTYLVENQHASQNVNIPHGKSTYLVESQHKPEKSMPFA